MHNTVSHKRVVKNSIGRVIFVSLAVILQIAWLVFFITRTGSSYPYIALGAEFLALICVFAIYSQKKSSASKTLWITLTLMFPVFGLVLFTLVGQPWSTRIYRRRMKPIDNGEIIRRSETRAIDINNAFTDPGIAGQMHYLTSWCHFPVYNDTKVRYHADTSEAYHDLLEELAKARKFIFMEYHAIQSAESFAGIEQILIERAKAGVEVRILYDDVGSAVFLGKDFRSHLNNAGIQCRVFNPLVPMVLAFMNNRDHRKITVIDGKVGFTGGYNLADEYFNINSPYGYWKDTGIVLYGSAVNSLTATFLELWNSVHNDHIPDSKYIIPANLSTEDGFVLPYSDSPLDDERIGENVYLNAIKNARKRVWFTTPYLILNDEMISELTLAAKRGVDVRIITPSIPDKKLVFQMSRSYYSALITGGVRIFEFTPGFIHAKQMLVDDELAAVGTFNLDYRSLYLHFENGVLLYKCTCIQDISQSFSSILLKCREWTISDIEHRPVRIRILQNILRLFSPLV